MNETLRVQLPVRPDPSAFWAPFETTVTSLNGFRRAIAKINGAPTAAPSAGRRVLAWRGMVDASWGLHSSLYRFAIDKLKRPPTELELAAIEQQVCAEFGRWGLHNRERGRMSALDQLATMQHYGAPTRLLDVTFNAYIALWFAVEQKPHACPRCHVAKEPPKNYDKIDGRVLAVDLTTRLINDNDAYRYWESRTVRPWARLKPAKLDEWCTRALAWRPAPLERRIAAQQGAFLLGGVPIYETISGKTNTKITKSKTTKYQWPMGTKSSDKKWAKDDVPWFICVAIRPNKFGASRGRRPASPCYTIRIAASAKRKIREDLLALFGYEHRTLFPDHPGFAEFGPLSWSRA